MDVHLSMHGEMDAVVYAVQEFSLSDPKGQIMTMSST
jgi:hypothetical protein